MRKFLSLAVVVALGTLGAVAQDPAKVDAKHYKVVFQDSMVRVLRVHYGPHEKSPMHFHPNATAVFLTDVQAKMTMPDGKSEMMTAKAGETKSNPAVTHSPENMSDKAMDLLLVELKESAKPAATPAKAGKAPKKTK